MGNERTGQIGRQGRIAEKISTDGNHRGIQIGQFLRRLFQHIQYIEALDVTFRQGRRDLIGDALTYRQIEQILIAGNLSCLGKRCFDCHLIS